ncbi:MAG: hypothetical protein ABSF44_06885 [Candidatus Bathyarchaeia archaeon]
MDSDIFHLEVKDDELFLGDKIEGTLRIISNQEFDIEKIWINLRCQEIKEKKNAALYDDVVQISDNVHIRLGDKKEFLFAMKLPFVGRETFDSLNHSIQWLVYGYIKIKGSKEPISAEGGGFILVAKPRVLVKEASSNSTNVTETFHIDYVGGQCFKNADCLFGIVNVTKDISAAVVRLYPPGTILKMKSGKNKLIAVKEAIIEISTGAKYDFKELGMWSKWPEPRTIHYSELKNNNEHSLNVSSEISCKFVLLESPTFVEIVFENELVYSFFRNKFLNKSVKTGDTIVLSIRGHNLPFYVCYSYPEEFVRIDGNTHISYIISSNQTTKIYPTLISNKYTVRMYPFPPEECMPKIPSRYKDIVQGGHDKQYVTTIQDHLDLSIPLATII